MPQASNDVIVDSRSRALQAFGTMRAHGARFYREYMAIRSSAQNGVCDATMPVGTHCLGQQGFVAHGALEGVPHR